MLFGSRLVVVPTVYAEESRLRAAKRKGNECAERR